MPLTGPIHVAVVGFGNAGRTFHAVPRPGEAVGLERFTALLPEAFTASHSVPIGDFALPCEALARPETIVAGAA